MFITKNDLELINKIINYLESDDSDEATYIKDELTSLVERLEIKTIVKNSYNLNRNKILRQNKKVQDNKNIML